MLTTITVAAVAATWLACLFTLLQLSSLGARRQLVAAGGAILIGLLVVVVRDSFPDPTWVVEPALRSDALSIGALVALSAITAAAVSSDTLRSTTWLRVTVVLAAISCAGAGFGALAIGRSGWYWEFAAVIGAGLVLVASGIVGVRDRSLGADPRIVFGAITAFGAFLVVGGSALLLAWRALA